jgi:hypothetical protein
MEVKRITPEQTKVLLDSNQHYIYLDVRTVSEFEARHVPGAKNVPVVEPDDGIIALLINGEVLSDQLTTRCCVDRLSRQRLSDVSF